MDFTTFTSRETIAPLAWLGRRDWIEFNSGVISRGRGLVLTVRSLNESL